ncbi:Protein R03H10.2 [Aphelenchoides avenae]|nr:Protein R03H10.2 [Aphelenchus avenae]
MISGFGPPPPPRTSSSKEPKTEESGWREAVGVLLAILLSLSVLFSVVTLLFYCYRDKAVYEELVDYLDKTVSISKINYNPTLGYYELRPQELEDLGRHRRYKALMWTYLFSDAGCYVMLGLSLFLYYSLDVVSKGTIHVLFWIFLVVGALYSLIEASTFTALIWSYSGTLPNSTEALMDHAVPYNPGGLMQMEHRLGCTFDQNLYNTFKRQQNPRNTCDPYITESFLSRGLMIAFVATRVFSLFLFALLAAKRTAVSSMVATLIARTRSTGGYKGRYLKNPKSAKAGHKVDIHTPKSTTFGVKDNRYNNAAYFATTGLLPGMNSSRSSEISKCDVIDLYRKGSTHTTNSFVSSEV